MTRGYCSASDSKNLRHAENDPPLLRLSDALHHRLVQLALDILRRVALEDSGLRLHHLSERPERHALAIRKRAAVPPVDEVGLRFDMREQLGDETALADPGNTDDRYERRRVLLPCALECIDELVYLPLAADERCSGRDRFRDDA
jgi:hypothetical protein